MAQERVEWADAARGLAIALVVLHHAVQRSVRAGGPEAWLAVSQAVTTVRMPLFFFVAGLFATAWLTERTWRRLLESKVLLFAWVFVLWVVIRYVWFLPQPSASAKETPPLADLALRLLSPQGGWFIYTLALMFVLGKLAARTPVVAQLAVTATLSLVWTSGIGDTANKAWDGVAAYSFFFIAGAYLPQLWFGAARWLEGGRGSAVIAVWAISSVVLAAFQATTWIGVSFALRVLGVAAGVALAVALRRHRSLRALGQSTLPIYMTHQLLVPSAVIALVAVHPVDSGPLGAAAPLLVAVPILLGTYHFGRLAPAIGLGWLYQPPRWLSRLVAQGSPHPPQDGRPHGVPRRAVTPRAVSMDGTPPATAS